MKNEEDNAGGCSHRTNVGCRDCNHQKPTPEIAKEREKMRKKRKNKEKMKKIAKGGLPCLPPGWISPLAALNQPDQEPKLPLQQPRPTLENAPEERQSREKEKEEKKREEIKKGEKEKKMGKKENTGRRK